MNENLSLFDDGWLDELAPNQDDVRAQSMWLRFLDFHTDHPDVMADLVEMLNDLRRTRIGRPTTVSIRDLFGAMRLDHLKHGPDRDGLALNNSFAAFYARAIVRRHPHLSDWIATRESAADREAAA